MRNDPHGQMGTNEALDTRPLPRAKKIIEFRARHASRASHARARIALGHAVKVERIRIGSNHKGEPIYTSYEETRTLCGAYSDKGEWNYEGPVNCDKCAAKLRVLEREGSDEVALAASKLRGTTP